MSEKPYLKCLLIISLLLWYVVPIEAASRDPVRSRNGMVVTTNPYATDVGVEILKRGGNAVDAAVAVGFALAVVHPAAGNIGGGGFMVIHLAGEGKETTIDYREMAPSKAHRDMYLDENGRIIRGLSTRGYLASGVPGSVSGLYTAWKKFGRLEWKELVQPAIKLAGSGFKVRYAFARSLESSEKKLSINAESRRIFLRNGDFYREGEIFRQPELARTLERIALLGPDGFYRGETADLIVRDMQENGGLISRRDLERYESKIREPIRGVYRGYEIVSMGPPSSGGVILVEMLNMIESYPVSRLGFGSSGEIHLKAEVMRRAFADRAAYLGDPDYSPIPVRGLISKRYAAQRSAGIRPDWATPSRAVMQGDPYPYESEETTHYSIVDGDGNAVAATSTINGGYGSGITIRGAGFLMNNEMDDFTSKVGEPNMYGLIQSEVNAIGPGKRPLSAMTPTIVKKEGKLFMVLGSPGGPTIINTVFQVILNVLDHGFDIQEAVDRPRIHHQWLPDRIDAEKDGIARDVLMNLEARGHRVRFRGRIGDAHSILIDPESGIRLGAADPRSDSKAAGY